MARQYDFSSILAPAEWISWALSRMKSALTYQQLPDITILYDRYLYSCSSYAPPGKFSFILNPILQLNFVGIG